MEIYFNDLDLCEEFYDKFDDIEIIYHSINEFSILCELIKEKKNKIGKKMGLTFYASKKIIKDFFDFLGDENLFDEFLYELTEANIKFWDDEKKQTDKNYYFYFDINKIPPVSINIKNSTLAEAVERKILFKNDILALNLQNLYFKNLNKILIHRIDYYNNIEPIFIKCVDNKVHLDLWIEENLDKTIFEYDNSSDIPPTDLQTCLKDKSRFEMTNEKCQNRKIYREIETKKLWYVDNEHTGKKALQGKGKLPHLEVFEPNGKKHLGEANLEGIYIDETKKDKNKKPIL